MNEDFYEQNKKRLYPFTKSMLYQFDEYFNPIKDTSCDFNLELMAIIQLINKYHLIY